MVAVNDCVAPTAGGGSPYQPYVYRRAELIAQYEDDYCNPYVAAERGLIDEVIRPSETRRDLCEALEMLLTKRSDQPQRKHGNIPL